MLRRRLIEEPRDRLQLIVEIWAESARNPAIDAIRRKADEQVRAGLLAMIAAAEERGEAAL